MSYTVLVNGSSSFLHVFGWADPGGPVLTKHLFFY